MKIQMRLRCQVVLVLSFIGLSSAEDDYENKLTKLWSLSSASTSDGSAVVNVTSASILIQPTSYSNEPIPARTSRESKLPYSYKKYAFRPRAIPLRSEPQEEKTVYYSQDNVNKYKSEVLFPGNYFPIAKEKSNENLTRDSYNPLEGGPFHPKSIPLMRGQMFEKRSLDDDEEPIIEKPEGFSEAVASRRSISDILGVDEDEDYQTEVEEEEDDDEEAVKGHKGPHGIKNKRKGLKKGKKQLTKYMLPLLLAYKLKYFALVPLLIGGLVLLVGATGLAGFFFALFAAVMGLQKGGY
ncbi:uncharacterized protein LOC126376940 [Pectinophora gossypiella]|uniref:uncharacterized protein LOC126376940 n=1 Tax=Pectinophora gossypiella TaxID=13191 RepID=UPI00214F524F|nr:uncharacterized protein LOC126376940 [Pectinophora gossypiella]